MFGSALKYIRAQELASQIRENDVLTSGKMVIFDVRGEGEYREGHIKGANHLPSTQWHSEAFVDEVISKFATGDAAASRCIVLHCAYSQQRGPTCARILERRLAEVSVVSGVEASALPSV
jgi:Cdc25 family phosphatase